MEPVIRVEFKFEEEVGLPSYVLTDTMRHIEDVLYKAQREELDELENIPDLPRVAFEAAQQRMMSYQGTAFIIKQVKKGSIIVEGAFTLLAMWLLKSTVGETLKEAYKDSKVHNSLKARLKTPISKEHLERLCRRLTGIRPSFYSHDIRSRHPRNYHLPPLELEIKIIEEDMKTIIKIMVPALPPDKIPPTETKALED